MKLKDPLIDHAAVTGSAVLQGVFVKSLVRLACVAACHLHTRFDLHLAKFRPLSAADVRLSEDCRRSVSAEFMLKSPCCLAPEWRKYRQTIHGQALRGSLRCSQLAQLLRFVLFVLQCECGLVCFCNATWLPRWQPHSAAFGPSNCASLNQRQHILHHRRC